MLNRVVAFKVPRNARELAEVCKEKKGDSKTQRKGARVV